MSETSKSLTHLDDPGRVHELRALLRRKAFLRRFYLEVYGKYRDCLERCPREGIALELGSGAGFAKEVVPELVTSDTIAYPGVDQVVDATRMPFGDASLRAVFMMNVFHHIPDAEAFLRELERCLKPGGRAFILDQHVGWFSRGIYARAHHEPFRPDAGDWRFETSGPLSGANGALAWIVFQRDHARFEKQFPRLKLVKYETHSPLRYWVSGGLKPWTLVPGFAFGALTALERALLRLTPDCGSFVDIELVSS